MDLFNIQNSLSRGEYWVRLLFVYFVLALGYGANILLQGTDAGVFIGGVIAYAASVFTMIAVAVAVIQRLNDANRSPWWTLLLVVPTVGFVALVVFGCLKTKQIA